jgi:D-serine deaminase-like pyridoxal phosphate-dependent protein
VDKLQTIVRPTLLLNEAVCRANIRQMASKAEVAGIPLRPHFKTHQSLAIGEWFHNSAIDRIAVSSLAMAAYFAPRWKDILVAFPVNPREFNLIREVAAMVRLGLLVSNQLAAEWLAEADIPELEVWIEIDEGSGRTGFPVSDPGPIVRAVETLSRNRKLHIGGLLTHAGRTYRCHTPAEVLEVHHENMEKLARLKAAMPGMKLSYGDTPGCSLANDFSNMDELRPGNFVFYDVMQHQIGACRKEDIAVAVACPVVDKHMLYGGAVHLSKDSIEVNGRSVFGEVVACTREGWRAFDKPWYVIGLSQEHGWLDPHHPAAGTYQPGDLLGVLPVHSCLTADLYPGYLTTRGTWLEKFSMKEGSGLYKAADKT